MVEALQKKTLVSKLQLPPPKRGPRFGDLVYIRGIAMPIEGFPLYQPDAPKAYMVEAPIDVPHRVTWDGLRWANENNSRNNLEKTSSTSSASSGVESGHAPIPLKGYPPEAAQESESRKGIAAEGRNGHKQDRSQSRRSARPARTDRGNDLEAPPITPPAKRRATRRSQPSKPAALETSSFAAQARIAAAEAHVVVRAPKRRDPVLSEGVQALHIALDDARDKYRSTRTEQNAEIYFAAIEAVDQADPRHFLGRIHPLAPLPRYVPPDLDYAGISTRMDVVAIAEAPQGESLEQIMSCRICGCTDDNCTECVRKTGESCYWVEPGLCSACAPDLEKEGPI